MILALDLSTPRGTLAVVDRSGKAVFSEHFRAHRSHNALVFAPLKGALAACGTGGPTAVVIGTGPGSYTGVRVAISAGTGLAMAFGLPLIGWPSAEASEREGNVDGNPFAFVGDARRGKFFGADVHPDPGRSRGRFDVQLFDREGLREWLDARKQRSVWTFDPGLPAPAERAKVTYPEAERLGRLVAEMEADMVSELAEKPVEPIYLSAPFVTKPKGRDSGRR